MSFLRSKHQTNHICADPSQSMYVCVFSFKYFGTANRNHLYFIFRNQFCKALLGKCILTERSQSHVQVLYRHWCPFCGMFVFNVHSLLEQKAISHFTKIRSESWEEGILNNCGFCVQTMDVLLDMCSLRFFANFHPRMNQAR